METFTLINARIFTMNESSAEVSGLIIQDGRVSHILTGADGKEPPARGSYLDLGGKIVLPGLIDSHLHLRQYAETLGKVNCETQTKSDCLKRVREKALITAPGEWVLGHGWNHNSWTEGYGSAAELDQVTPDHPVYLTGKSLHLSWANSRALALAGIDQKTPDPPGGVLQRDTDGYPTGILFEEAVKLIETIIPEPTVDQVASSIIKAQESLWKMGLTGVHDFDRVLCIQALQLLTQEDQLHLRVQKSIPSEFLDQAIQLGYRTGEGTDWLWFGGVKDFMDGALGPQTAAMLSPYQGSGNKGLLLKTENEIIQLGRKAAAHGLSLSIHAIGDLANRTLLNALEDLRSYEKESGLEPLPHRIEHVQLIDPADLPRLAELNITASMQPIHATSDMEMAAAFWGERTTYSYAPQLQIEQGALVIFGSDAPVESPNPWLGIHAAVTRRRLDGAPGPEGWHPEGRVSLHQALEAFTINPARSAGREKLQGKLMPGYWADLIVLDTDPYNCPPEKLAGILPMGTMVAGHWVYRNF